jgi:hypothetical protein
MEPIGSMISGQRLKIAQLQDDVIDLIYDNFQSDALLYGGTAVWRCFGGTRFSEGIDVYMKTGSFNRFISALTKYDLSLSWRDPEFPSRVRIARGETNLLLETKPGFGENEIRSYSRTDGTTKTITTLTPTEMMTRKIEAYQSRGYVRDVYDLFVLTRWLDKSDFTVRSRFSKFLEEVQRPVDESILESLLYAGGRGLEFPRIIEYIRRWLDEI